MTRQSLASLFARLFIAFQRKSGRKSGMKTRQMNPYLIFVSIDRQIWAENARRASAQPSSCPSFFLLPSQRRLPLPIPFASAPSPVDSGMLHRVLALPTTAPTPPPPPLPIPSRATALPCPTTNASTVPPPRRRPDGDRPVLPAAGPTAMVRSGKGPGPTTVRLGWVAPSN